MSSWDSLHSLVPSNLKKTFCKFETTYHHITDTAILNLKDRLHFIISNMLIKKMDLFPQFYRQLFQIPEINAYPKKPKGYVAEA